MTRREYRLLRRQEAADLNLPRWGTLSQSRKDDVLRTSRAEFNAWRLSAALIGHKNPMHYIGIEMARNKP